MVKKEKKVETTKEEKKVEPEVLEEVVQEKEEKKEKKGGREARFKKLLEAYQIQNPVKYESKKENGEFSPIPNSFK